MEILFMSRSRHGLGLKSGPVRGKGCFSRKFVMFCAFARSDL